MACNFYFSLNDEKLLKLVCQKHCRAAKKIKKMIENIFMRYSLYFLVEIRCFFCFFWPVFTQDILLFGFEI